MPKVGLETGADEVVDVTTILQNELVVLRSLDRKIWRRRLQIPRVVKVGHIWIVERVFLEGQT